MFFNKMKKTEDNNRRVSFEDLPNEMCEYILQFLPIKDKFRVERVSKQFQRTVYEKHEDLCLKEKIISRMRSMKTIEQSETPFERLLQKLPNIKSIRYERD